MTIQQYYDYSLLAMGAYDRYYKQLTTPACVTENEEVFLCAA
jgi:hypothetical protein